MKNKNVLKMTAYQVSGNLWHSKLRSEKDVPIEEMCNNSWWYLHGELCELVGFDKAITTNCKSAGYSRETINWSEIHDGVVTALKKGELTRPVMYVNDIIPVEVEGIDIECVGYFWTTDENTVEYDGKKYPYWQQRGLVCFKDDVESCEYAMEKYQEKAWMI